MGTKSSAKESGRARRTRRRRAPAFTGGLGLLIGIAVGAALFRVLVAFDLAQNPLLIRPALEDGVYLSEMRATQDGEDVLPRGSFLYPVVGSVFPGTGGGDANVVRIAQCAIEGLTTLILGLWVRRRFGIAPAAAASVLYLLDPIGGFFSARLSPVVWSTLLFVLALSIYDRGRDEQGTARLWITGAMLALGFLFSPLLFTIAAGICAWDLWKVRTGKRGAEAEPRTQGHPRWSPLVVIAPLALVAMLVLLRNDRVPGGGPIVSSGSGISAYRAASPKTGGTERALEPPSWETELQVRTLAWEALEQEVDDYQVHRFYATRAFQQVIENPVETIGVLLTKSAGTIGAWPLPDALSADFLFDREAPYLGYGMFTFAVLLGLAVGGFLLTSGETGARSVLLGLGAVGLTCLIGPASAASRHAALPLLAIFGGVWVAGWRDRRRNALSPAAPRVLGAVAGGVGLSIVAGFLSPTSALRNPSEDYRLAANTFLTSDNPRPALPLLEKAVETDPSNLEARVALARVYQTDGLVNAAMEQLETALAADSTHNTTILTLASLEMMQNNPERALQLMARVVNAHPANPLYLNQYGSMLFQTGQIAQAQPFFRRALEIKPDYTVARDNLKMVEEYIQRMEQAVYPPEMRLAPDDPLNRIPELTVQAMDAQDWSRADSLIQVIENARAEIVLPHFLRAAYHVRRSEVREAVLSLERCQQLAPCRPVVIDYLAGLYIQMGRAADALRLIFDCERTATTEAEKQAFAAMRKNLETQPGP